MKLACASFLQCWVPPEPVLSLSKDLPRAFRREPRSLTLRHKTVGPIKPSLLEWGSRGALITSGKSKRKATEEDEDSAWIPLSLSPQPSIEEEPPGDPYQSPCRFLDPRRQTRIRTYYC